MLDMGLGCMKGTYKQNYRRLDIASVGIGTVIVFIAMVLVAGIAANVLIQVSNSLENQAMQSGIETIGEVSSGIVVEDISYHNNSGLIDLLAIQIKSRAGSGEVDLSEVVIQLSNSIKMNLFTYDSYVFTDTDDVDGDFFDYHFYPGCDGVSFGIIVLQDVDDSLSSSSPVLTHNDHVVLTINLVAAFNGLDVRTDVSGEIICEGGASGVISFKIPPRSGDPPDLGFSGSAEVFESASTREISVAALDSTHVVIGYMDDDNSDFGTALVGTVSGSSISYGSPVVFNSGMTFYVSVAALVGTVSGSSISFCSPVVFPSPMSFYVSVAAIDRTHVVIGYGDWDNSRLGTAVVATITGGDTISFDSPLVFESADTYHVSVTALDRTHVVIGYQDDENSDFGTAIVGDYT